jgi:hypothetical protein
LNRAEMRTLYVHAKTGQPYAVTDDAVGQPRSAAPSTSPPPLSSLFSRARAWMNSFQ